MREMKRKVPNINNHIFKQPGLPWADTVSCAFSDDACAVIDRMTEPTEIQQNSIATFVDAEVLNGNYELTDEFFCLSLGATNGLVGFKSKTAVKSGTVVFDINGANYAGAGRIDTNWDNSADGVNSTQNDNMWGFYCKVTSGTANAMWYIQGNNNNSYFQRVTSNARLYNNGTSFDVADAAMQNDSLYMSIRDASDNADVYRNGVVETALAENSTVVVTGNVNIGGKADDTNYVTGIVSTVIMGGGIGFDPVAHNTNVRALLTNLGVSL